MLASSRADANCLPGLEVTDLNACQQKLRRGAVGRALYGRFYAGKSEALPAGSTWTTDAEYDAITAYFQAPGDDENFNVVRHVQG